MTEKPGSVKIICDEHRIPPSMFKDLDNKDLDPKLFEKFVGRIWMHIVSEATFKSPEFLELVEETIEGKGQAGPDEMARMTEKWNALHPYACCFLGDKKLIELFEKELPKALRWGTSSQPLSNEEAHRLGLDEYIRDPEEDPES